MWYIWLWTKLGSSSDVRASVRLSRRVNGVIVDINGEGELSVPGSGVRLDLGVR